MRRYLGKAAILSANSKEPILSQLTIDPWLEAKAPVVILKPGDTRIFDCVVEIKNEDYPKIVNQEVIFLVIASWEESEDQRLDHHDADDSMLSQLKIPDVKCGP